MREDFNYFNEFSISNFHGYNNYKSENFPIIDFENRKIIREGLQIVIVLEYTGTLDMLRHRPKNMNNISNDNSASIRYDKDKRDSKIFFNLKSSKIDNILHAIYNVREEHFEEKAFIDDYHRFIQYLKENMIFLKKELEQYAEESLKNKIKWDEEMLIKQKKIDDTIDKLNGISL